MSNSEVVLHTLLSREIRPIFNWHEWLEDWQAAKTFQEMESLLHNGFSVSLEQGRWDEKKYDEIDRVAFYLTIADGWTDEYKLHLPTDNGKKYAYGRDANSNTVRVNQCKLRRMLAQKAFDVLCQNFFKMEFMADGRHGKEFTWVVREQIISERLFPVIVNFFRIEKREFGDDMALRNLTPKWGEPSRNEQLVKTFLLNLAKFLWEWKEPEVYDWEREKDEREQRNVAIRQRIDAAKPWMVEVLAHIHHLDLLEKWLMRLDKPCLGKLKELALSYKLTASYHPVVEARRVATIDEACYAGSKAAWLLKKHELMKAEGSRLRAIYNAEQEKAEADRKIKKLTKHHAE